ncbi:MAG: carbohydrate kinase family protein [Terriglobia bacterium]
MSSEQVDVAGVGLNATDTVMLVRSFPSLGGKEQVASVSRQAGGQVATAMVACRRLGLTARYLGTVGDDDAGRFQMESLVREGVDAGRVRITTGTPTQFGFIIVDASTGERTVFWDRDPRLAMKADEVFADDILTARAVLLDGCDVSACLAAAQYARRAGIPVLADLDTAYENVETLFPSIDHMLASTNFLPAATGESDPFRALEMMVQEYKMTTAGMTIGEDGSLVFTGGRFIYSPGFVVETVDTTGAGDVFRGAFIHGLLSGWTMELILEFSNAMAALNCTALGARGGIRSETEAVALIKNGARHVHREYAQAAGVKG